MPTRNLTPADTFSTIGTWLDQNLRGPIVPVPQSIPNIPQEKGLYFWFMKPEGYAALSNFVDIAPVEPCYKKEIDGEKYHLVYLGTAGTGKKGNSNLSKRLEWHITQAHTRSSVCSGTLSTLRAGIGSLVSDDLILPTTEDAVNVVFKKYFQVYWIEYTEKDIEFVDPDELVLIRALRPLFNIKQNPNAIILGHITYLYKIRRRSVYKATKVRLGCGDNEDDGGGSVAEQSTSLQESPPISSETDLNVLLDSLGEEYDMRRIFNIYASESIHDVVQNLHGYLPNGPCKIVLYDPRSENIVYSKARSTGRNNQNIFTYFGNVDTNRDNLPRWQIIQNEMTAMGVSEILVEVFY